MKEQGVVNRFRILVIAALVVMLTISIVPIPAAHAQVTPTSDLVVRLVSIPRHAKACEVFVVTFTVTNLGPDPADSPYISLIISDHFDILGPLEAPQTLAVGETATVSAAIKVTAFVPGETRTGRVLASATFDSEMGIDPNPDNNFASGTIRLISKPAMSC